MGWRINRIACSYQRGNVTVVEGKMGKKKEKEKTSQTAKRVRLGD